MVYLVTGGTGFIGAYVARLLSQEGATVVAYDLAPDENAIQKVLAPDELARIAIVRGDVTDLPHLVHTIKEHRAEQIVHLAYLMTDAAQANAPLAIKINCEGTNDALEAARILGLRRVVWASSIAVFGPRSVGPEGIVANDAPYDPQTIYGACKSLNEVVAAHYSTAYGLDTIGLRFPTVYGAGRMRGAGQFVSELIEKPAQGLPGHVPYGDYSTTWAYVEDVARAVVLACQAPPTKTRAFNLGGDVRPVREAAAWVQRLLPQADLTFLPGTRLLPSRFDATLAQQELGWQPQYSMEEGIRKTINYWRRQRGLAPV